MILKIKIEQNGQTSTQTIDKSKCMIGRAGTDVLLTDRKCSRHHCVIFEMGKGILYLRDLDSSNGTLVDGTVVRETQLKLNQEIRIGNCKLWVVEYHPSAMPENIPEPTDAGSIQNELLSQWPDMIRSHQKEQVASFIDHLDEAQKMKSIRLQDLVKKKSSK